MVNSPKKVLVLGGLIIDKYLLVDKYPASGGDVLINDSFERVGGSTINVTRTLQNLGLAAYPVSLIGDDREGREIEKYLIAAQINRDCVKPQPGQRTGYSLVIVDASSERTFMTYKGCESQFLPDLIPASLVTATGLVYLTGYFLLNKQVADIVAVIQNVKQQGAAILFDPGPLVGEIEASILLTVLKLTDILTPNEKELDKIKAKLAIIPDFVEWANGIGITYVMIKNGSKGVSGYTGHAACRIPAYAVTTVDTTGAGDCFAAGCIYGFMNKLPFADILRVGAACGALNTTFIGPNGNFSLDDVKKLIKGD